MRLRRSDGLVYMDRWGIQTPIGGLYLHRFNAPDPGIELHDHPWDFVSLILCGGYTEERATSREAPTMALQALWWETCRHGVELHWGAGSIHRLRLDECHRIITLDRVPTWTLVARGPRRRRWGFYMPEGYMDEREYDATVRAARRDLWNEVGS